MLEADTISMNLLSFRSKSFAFDHAAEVEGEPYTVFARTETESEAKLRPNLVKLRVAVPTGWLLYDEAVDELVLGEDGVHPGPRSTGVALESAADAERFVEQGIPWVRTRVGEDGVLYVPAARAPSLLAPSIRPLLTGSLG